MLKSYLILVHVLLRRYGLGDDDNNYENPDARGMTIAMWTVPETKTLSYVDLHALWRCWLYTIYVSSDNFTFYQ